MTYITAVSGAHIHVPAPNAGSINIHDIARSLSHLCRFTGHVERFYSVAQHSVLVSMLVQPEARMAALLHDAHEAYIGDIATPWKEHIPDFRDIENRLQAIVLDALDVSSSFSYHYPEIHHADLVMLATERRDLLVKTSDEWPCLRDIGPDRRHIIPWNPETARMKFLAAFDTYGGFKKERTA